MIDEAICNGCVHWRTVGWKDPKQNLRNRACHCLLDTGRSRVKYGDTKVCSARVQKAGDDYKDQQRMPQHKFDFKPKDLERAKRHHSGGRKLTFSAEQAKALIAEGKTDEEAAKELGIKLRTFKDWRLRNKIQGNRKRSWTWKNKNGGVESEDCKSVPAENQCDAGR